MKGAQIITEKENYVGNMKEIKIVNFAAKKGVPIPTIPKKEVFVPSMAQSVNLTVMKDVHVLPKKEVSVPSME